MKRKASKSIDSNEDASSRKRAAVTRISKPEQFQEELFSQEVLDELTTTYSESKPFKHGVIRDLVSPELLRNVRSEIQENLSFTPKETDIYRIYQSGDLANLDGLDDSSLKLLPSLLKLRDALYSTAFRDYLSTITGSGPLSGRKTDMAINVYTPGCHLLCHDDVIGSRKVSYILYLTDPDKPWKQEWGGALRLYPTVTHTMDNGEIIKVPSPDHDVLIPPAFNQLSFFAVQPGESFHDVEEVFASQEGEEDGDDVRIRTAISGWYHIPQEGEEGFMNGLEEKLAEKSSLMQLQGKNITFDLPKMHSHPPEVGFNSSFDTANNKSPALEEEDLSLTENDLNFLIKYISPTYLTPYTLESILEEFNEQFSLTLDAFLTPKFSDSLREFISIQESQALATKLSEIEQTTPWLVARPPHKHRFLFQQIRETRKPDLSQSPLQDLLENLLPSGSFFKWLQLATGQAVSSHNLLARRFRRGKDYTLATGYDEEDSRLEITLAITPTTGWEPDTGMEEKPDEDDDGVNEKHDNDAEEGSDNTQEIVDKKKAKTEEDLNDNAVVAVREEINNKKDAKTEEDPTDNAVVVANEEIYKVEEAKTEEDLKGNPGVVAKEEIKNVQEAMTEEDLKSNPGVVAKEEIKNVQEAMTEEDPKGNPGVDAKEEIKHVQEAKTSDWDEEKKKGLQEKDQQIEKIVKEETEKIIVEEEILNKSLKSQIDGEVGKTAKKKKEKSTAEKAETTSHENAEKPDTAKDKPDEPKEKPEVADEKTGGAEEQTEAEKKVDDAEEQPHDHSKTLGSSDIGGYLMYMANDEDVNDQLLDEEVQGQGADFSSEMTGAQASGLSSSKDNREVKADPAIYQTSGQGDGDDDGTLFSMPAGWNKLGIVLRDKGVMRFVKYVSQQAKGDRWDVCGEYGVIDQEDDEDENEVQFKTREVDQNAYDITEEEMEEETETSDDY